MSTAVSLADSERAYLADLLDRLGPDAPTLCEGWQTRHLAAHLVLRERRPDAAAGILIAPLASWTEKVQADYSARDYSGLVESVRQGPPAWSPLALPRVYGLVNSIELFVHHEDVRRAQPEWQPRELDADVNALLWDRLARQARLLFRKTDVGLVLSDGARRSHTVRATAPSVTLTGPPGELLLYAFGRRDHAQVQVDGEAEAQRRLARSHLGL